MTSLQTRIVPGLCLQGWHGDEPLISMRLNTSIACCKTICCTLWRMLSSCPEVHVFKTGKRRSRHGVQALIFAGAPGKPAETSRFSPEALTEGGSPMVESCGGKSCCNTTCGGIHSPRCGVSPFSRIHFLEPASPLVTLAERRAASLLRKASGILRSYKTQHRP